MRLYEASGHDLLIVRDGLGHRSTAVTQVYLPTALARVESLILKPTGRAAIRAAPNWRPVR